MSGRPPLPWPRGRRPRCPPARRAGGPVPPGARPRRPPEAAEEPPSSPRHAPLVRTRRAPSSRPARRGPVPAAGAPRAAGSSAPQPPPSAQPDRCGASPAARQPRPDPEAPRAAWTEPARPGLGSSRGSEGMAEWRAAAAGSFLEKLRAPQPRFYTARRAFPSRARPGQCSCGSLLPGGRVTVPRVSLTDGV